MHACLRVVDGPDEGREVRIASGESVTVGRTGRATSVFDLDRAMSAVHFEVSLFDDSLRLQNFSRTNGTLVNGKRLEQGVVVVGDRITAGQTVFEVVGLIRSAPFSVGSWRFGAVPQGWEPVAGLGLRLVTQETFKPTVVAVEEPLPHGQTLEKYLECQKDLIRQCLPEAGFQGPEETRLRDAAEAFELTTTSPLPDRGRAIQRQIYARSGGVVGVITITIPDGQAERLGQTVAGIVAGLSFSPPTPATVSLR
jgi:pSer/pThr/pTyr-binding forkhead associated (FHA) protein